LVEIWRRWGWGKRAAALWGVMLILALPPGLWWGPSAALRYALTRGLEGQGLRVAALDQAVLSLTQGRIDLRKLDVQPPLGAPVTVARIELEFSWRALLAGRVEIAKLSISGIDLRLERGRDGNWRLPLPSAAPSAPAQAEPFAIGVARLIATEGRVTLVDGARSLRVDVELFDVSGFDLRQPGRPLRVELAAALAGGRVRASGEAAPLAAIPTAMATIRAASVDLASLAPFLCLDLAGTLGGEVSVRADAASIDAQGEIELARLRAPGATVEALSWRGRAGWSPARGLEIDGTTQARGLAAAPVGAAAMRFEGRATIGAEIALDGAASFEAPSFEAPDTRIAATRLTAAALRAGRGARGWTLAADAAAEGVAVVLPAGEIALDTLKAPGLRARMTGADGRLETPFEVGVASFGSPDLRARFENLRSGGLTLDFGAQAAFAGRFASARAEIAAGDLRAGFGGLELDLRRSSWAQALAAEFRLALTDAALDTPDFAARASSSTVDGRWTGARFEGQIAAERAAIDLKSAKVDARAANAAADIAFDMSRAALEGRARLGELRLRRADGLDLAEIGALAIDGIALSGATRRASAVLAERVRILRREAAPAFPWRLEAPRLEIGGVAVAADGAVRVGPLRTRGAVLRVTRTATGFASLDAILADGDPAAPPGPGFRVESVAVDDSRLEFEDRALATPVRVDADRVALRFGAIDTAAPAAPTRASLRARVGGAGALDLQGDATPLAPKIGFDLTGTARGVDLPPFSPYVATALGADLRTGRFDLDFRLTARDEALAGASHWRLQNLEIDDRGAGALAREAGAPLAMALGFLRDRRGDIALDVPISGKLDDPSFDASDAVRQAVGGAMRGALSATFNALFPFGFILGELVAGEALPALPPVGFAPGLASFDDRASAALDALAGVLASRPSVRLEICGFAGPADLRALAAARGTDPRGQELAETLRRLFARATGAAPSVAGEDELRGLAEERARAVKDRLAGRAGVDAARLFECRPVVETDAGANPRVELKF
jgi:hypothetical protein